MHTHDAHTKKIATRYSWRRGVFFNIDIFLQFLKIRNVEKNLSKQAAVCIVDSETDRRAILSLNPQLDTRVVPIGFDPQIYCPDGRKAELSGKSVIFTGNMGSDQTEFAAIELIEKIMPRIWGEHPDARLYLVGANPSKRLFSYDDRIIVTGFVDNVAEYLRGATVYVCPLRIGSGMKTRIIEALAAGSALISTRSGLEGLMPGEDSDRPWVHAESTIELAAAANDLLAAPQTVKDLSCRAAAYALRQNSWQAVAERIERIYEDISS